MRYRYMTDQCDNVRDVNRVLVDSYGSFWELVAVTHSEIGWMLFWKQPIPD